MTARKLKVPIPVTILTGSLGVGKTTALCKLVAQKPADEVWCCIVNEFGAVGIDAVAIVSNSPQQSNVVVKQIAGGCMCCVLSGPLSAAIAQVIRQVKPDRVIIEPSGLGHPGGLIDILQGPHLCSSLQLNAVLCVVDLASFDPAALMSNDVAADQITVADILIGSKADVAAPGAVESFQQWASEDLFPPKSEVHVMSNGNLLSSLLNAPRAAAAGRLTFTSKRSSRASKQQQSLMHAWSATAGEQPGTAVKQEQGDVQQYSTVAAVSVDPESASSESSTAPQPGQPVQVLGVGHDQQGQYMSCGWVFHQQDRFDQVLLKQLLQDLQPLVARVKGVFRVGAKQWVMPASSGLRQGQPAAPKGQQGDEICQQTITSTDLILEPICYRGDSMVEVIINIDSMPLQELQGQLQRVVSRLQEAEGGSEANKGDHGSHVLSRNVGDCKHTAVMDDMGHSWCVLQKALVQCLRDA